MLEAGKINTILDLSWGSSGKGQTASYLAEQYAPEVLISTCRSNASHSVYQGDDGFVFKILPTASAICRWNKNYEPHIFVGPTSSFDVDQLIKEIQWCGLPKERVFVHPRAMVNQQKHSDIEAGGENCTKHLGSTMSGAGAVYAEKVMRGNDTELAYHFKDQLDEHCTIFMDEDAFMFTIILAGLLDEGCIALAELSQGFPLSIDHSLSYKYSTSRNVVPAQMLSDLGLRPDYQGKVIANIRSYPIRVSNRFVLEEVVMLVNNPKNVMEQILMHADQLGFTYNQVNAVVEDLWINKNTRIMQSPIYGEVTVHEIESGIQGWSGPCEADMSEVDWETMTKMAGMEDDTYHELTTLTKLPRRIFTIDDGSISKELLGKFKIACGSEPIVAVTFLNYVDWECNNITSPEQISPKVRAFIDQANEDLAEIFGDNIQVNMVQFGRSMEHIFEI